MGQKEMAQLASVSPGLIQSVELRRATLTPEVAGRIAEATGCDLGWLLDGDVTKPIINSKGEPYTFVDAVHAMIRQLNLGEYYQTTGPMQLCVAYAILRRVLDMALEKGNDAGSDRFGFVYRLDRFVRSELDQYPTLRDKIYNEVKPASAASSAPLVSILIPTSAKRLRNAEADFQRAASAFEDQQDRLRKKRPEKPERKVIKK